MTHPLDDRTFCHITIGILINRLNPDTNEVRFTQEEINSLYKKVLMSGYDEETKHFAIKIVDRADVPDDLPIIPANPDETTAH